MKRKGQEELVGFVAVVVLVLVIGLIYLTLSLRHTTPQAIKSVEVSQFLESARHLTVFCESSFYNQSISLARAFELCRRGAFCGSSSSCDLLNNTTSGMIRAALNPGAEQPVQAFELNARYLYSANQSSVVIPFFKLAHGACGNLTRRGSEAIYPAEEGVIEVELFVCP